MGGGSRGYYVLKQVLLQLCKRMLQKCAAVKRQKCFVDCETSADFQSARGCVHNNWNFIFEWTYPLRVTYEFFNKKISSIWMSVNRQIQTHDPSKAVMCIVFTVHRLFYLRLLILTPARDQKPKPLLIETQRCYKLRLLFLPPPLPLVLARLLHIFLPAVPSSISAVLAVFPHSVAFRLNKRQMQGSF